MSGDAGWSAVVHHPSDLALQNWNWDENEGERELPSTVDMDAIKGGGSWNPAGGTTNDTVDSDDESESSDSAESANSAGSDGSCSYSDSNSESGSDDSTADDDSCSNSDCTSEQSEQTFSIQETNYEQGSLKLKISKAPKKEEIEKLKSERPLRKAPARRAKAGNSKLSESSSDDSDSSDSGPAQGSQTSQQQPQQPQQSTSAPSGSQPQLPLQEINQEDLAAILPEQEHEEAPFDGFEDSESGRLVSKAIERMSLGADSDASDNADQNPVPVPYSSSLLQQFAEKSAMLSEPRKKRSGKLVNNKKIINESEYACASNVSPDSGIQSVNNSPLHLATSPATTPAPSQSPSQSHSKQPAVNVDRVLYPPKRKPGRPAKNISSQPRGPGRPRAKVEVDNNKKTTVDKRKETVVVVSGNNKQQSKDAKSNNNSAVVKSKTAPPPPSARDSKEEEPASKKRKIKGNKKSSAVVTVQEKPSTTTGGKAKKLASPEKCLSNKVASGRNNNSGKDSAKSMQQETTRLCRNGARSDNNKSSSVQQQSKTNATSKLLPVVDEIDATTKGKKSLKENRNNAQQVNKKNSSSSHKKSSSSALASGTTSSRRVLKENKSSKKTTTTEQEAVGLQTVISVPVVSSSAAATSRETSNHQKDRRNDSHGDAHCDKALHSVQGSSSSNRHRRHHHKHKRRLMAVAPKRPIKVDPSVTQELEKLIEEFAKCCSLGKHGEKLSTASSADLPQIFRVKKITKKRQKGEASSTSDEQKQKRRVKKEKAPASESKNSEKAANASSNPNEQRLPLKKRHYHASSPHSSQHSNASTEANANEASSAESHIEEAIEAAVRFKGKDKVASGAAATREPAPPVTPKKRHRDADHHAPPESTNGHESTDSMEDKPLDQLELLPRRKKKVLKDLRVTVTKLTSEVAASEKTDKPDNSKSHKEERSEKLEVTELPSKSSSGSKVDSAAKVNKESSKQDEKSIGKSEVATTTTSSNPADNSSEAAAPVAVKKKPRRRKAINRTGFPTVKKKKKKKPPPPPPVANDAPAKVAAKLEKPTTTIVNNNSPSLSSVDEGTTLEEKTKLMEAQNVLPVVVIDESEANKKQVSSRCNNSSRHSVMSRSEEAAVESCAAAGQLRVRRDLVVECDGSRPCDKLCPVKYEKVQDSRMYDENATLEESLERYNMSQRIGELNEENLRQLERSSSESSVKMECYNNNNNNNDNNNHHKRRRASVSPCNHSMRLNKRLRTLGYDTESDALQSSDIASDDQALNRTAGKVASSSSKRKQPKWKKRYLQAGLFSDYYKEDAPRKVNGAESTSTGKNKLANYDPSEHPHGLLPPPHHCGKFLRQRKIPFQLPYDLWWLHTHSRLPGRDLVPSWNYRKIRTNVYYDVKPTTLYESQACECKSESGCGDDCINRMVFSECTPQLCPCEEKCKNQKIQKHEWAPGLQRFMTEDKGWGVQTQEQIRNGDFILEYVGEVVSEKEFKSRMATRYSKDTHHYCLHLDGGLVIDGHRMGGDGRFVNHSCEPNCNMQKWSVHGLPRMALFASRDIQKGEELTYDYNFALFNPSEGQQCRCGSTACRGVIGGKSQRVAKPPQVPLTQSSAADRKGVGRPRKNMRKSNVVQSSNSKGLMKGARKVGEPSLVNLPMLKPMSNQQRAFAQEHHCFLLRNLEKVRRMKTTGGQTQVPKAPGGACQTPKEKTVVESKSQSDAIFTQLAALTNNSTSRTVRTRRLALAQDDPEMSKTAKLAKVLKDLYAIVATANDENGQPLCTPFITLPAKRKLPEYYEKVQDPIDLSMIDQCINVGHYKTAEQFDQDMIKLFDNNVKYFGRTSEIGIAAARLRKLYLGSKADFVEAITTATGAPPSHGFLPPRGSSAGEEDVIRCICGLHRDEGLMIQCERCLVWQHCDCVKADTSVESYLCERCQPRDIDMEIPLEGEDEEEEGKKYFVTLMRGDLQLRQGDTVYVLRDTPEKHTYKTIQKFDYEQMDIFRIETLWKNNEGERFVFGHHYLRPHETYHEPTRKFYENEVVCAPLYEAVPCELVAERCWVLDPNTYCRGRPVGASPEHIYVCEYRVDRAARLFSKVARSRHQICKKPYAFEIFPERIRHTRTYLPHSLDNVQGKLSKKNADKAELNGKENQQKSFRGKRQSADVLSAGTSSSYLHINREQRIKKLNGILLNLLNNMPNKKDPLDLSFLLERNRRNRKKPGNTNP